MTVSNPLAGERTDRLRQALESRYERADRITSGKHDIGVKILRPGEIPSGMENVPGWTDGKTINLNNKMLDIANLDSKGLIAALGVNHHELAHVMFTPSIRGALARQVRNSSSWNAFNILEDQRAESFFVAQFSDAKRYYTSMILRWLTATDKQWEGNYVLIYGRRFLPFELVAEFKRRFSKPHLLSDFEDVINEYRAIGVPDSDLERDRSLALIRQFQYLLNELNDQPQAMGDHQQKTEQPLYRPVSDDDLEEEVEAQDFPDDIEEVLEDEDEASESDSEDGEPGDGGDYGDDEIDAEEAAEGSGDDVDDQDEGEEFSDGSGSGEGDETSDEEGDGDGAPAGEGEGESESTDEGEEGGDGAGTAHVDVEGESPSSDTDLLDYLHDAIEEIESSDEVAKEISDTTAAVRQIASGVWKPSLPREEHFIEYAVTLDHIALIRKVERKLQDTRTSAETVLRRNVKHGRLDPLAYAKSRPGDLEVFEEWDEGLVGEEGEMDVAILVDRSSSMGGTTMDNASFTLYAIKRAFEGVQDTHVTCWTYNTAGTLLYDRGEKVNPARFKNVMAQGNTDPTRALQDAAKVLGTTRSRLRLLIVITDGMWGGAERGERIIKNANEAGVTTVLVGLNRAVRNFGSHECQVAIDLNKPDDLVEIAGEIASKMIREAEARSRGRVAGGA